MLWGLGTGRCGTASLAKMLGGVHEPGNLQVIGWLYGEDWTGSTSASQSRYEICDELARRAALDVPIIVDPRHSYVIPLIREVDPDAEFFWLYRDPVQCVESWLARGNWTPEDPLEGRYHPRGGYPADWSRIQKACWFYRSVNGLIRRDLLERFQVLRCPDDLTEHENENTDATWTGPYAVDLTKEDRMMIDEECGFICSEMDSLRERTKEEVL